MLTHRILYLSCFIALLLASCSVQKRQHLPGYHITWNSGASKENTSPTKTETAQANQTESDTTGVNIETRSKKEASLTEVNVDSPVQTQESKSSTNPARRPEKKSKNDKLEALKGVLIQPQAQSPKVNESDENSTEQTAVIGFAAILMSYVFFIMGGILGIAALSLLSFLLWIAAIVLAIVALVKISESGKKGKGLAIATIVLFAIPVIIVIIALIALAVYFT